MLIQAVCDIYPGGLSYPLFLKMERRVDRIRAVKLGLKDPGPETYPDE
jgi:hypothetical protein